MIVKQAIRNLMAGKLRLILTSLAVVLGVGFVAGAFVLGDTINRAFDNVFAAENYEVAVQVRGEGDVMSLDRRPVTPEVLEIVRGVDGVASADGTIQGFAQIVGKDGKAIGGQGPPTLGFNWDDTEANPMTLVEGHEPRAPNDMVIDTMTAKKQDFKVGDTVTVVGHTGPEPFRISGIARFGETGEIAGATVALFTTKTADRIFDAKGNFGTVEVFADPGVTPEQLRDRVAAALPKGYDAVTGEQAQQEQANSFKQFVDIFRNVLLGFAGVSLFVGAFIIFNAFQITIAQRARQIGLLRAVGASPRQIIGSVMLESVLVGVIASAIGLLFGILVAMGLRAMFDAMGMNLPDTGMVIRPSALLIAFVVGVVVTVLAAVGPALRSSRVPPIAAIQPAPPPVSSRTGLVLSLLVTVIGVAATLYGTLGDIPNTTVRVSAMAFGAIALFLGAAALTQYVARPLANLVGVGFARIGITGSLGLGNAKRNPHRTAQTASALTIGVALVTAVTMLGTSLQATFVGQIDKYLRADVVAFAPNDPQGFSETAGKVVADVPGIEKSTMWLGGYLRDADNNQTWVNGVDPEASRVMFDSSYAREGALADLDQPDTVAVTKPYAKEHDLTLGSTTQVTWALTGTKQLRVVAIVEDSGFGNFFVSQRTLRENGSSVSGNMLWATVSSGASADQVKDRVAEAVAQYPTLKVMTRQGFKDDISSQVTQFLSLFYILLAMAVIIALFGIVLTLALSVYERTREIGLLRAVGLSRRGVRMMIRWEAIIVSLIGAIVGVVVGLFLGAVAVSAFPELTEMAIPWGYLIVFFIVAALFGILAASLPARRAAKLNILEAVATE